MKNVITKIRKNIINEKIKRRVSTHRTSFPVQKAPQHKNREIDPQRKG